LPDRSRAAVLLAAAGAVALLGATFATVAAATAPEVHSILEGRDPATGRPVFVLLGRSLTKFTGYRVATAGGGPSLGDAVVLQRSKSSAVLALPEDLAGGTYDLLGLPGAGEPVVFPVRIDDGPWAAKGGNAVLPSGRAGIGTDAPAADLHMEGQDGILHVGTLGKGAVPAEGAGTRLMWVPGKGAFRGGTVSGSGWDDGKIGDHSFAFGDDATAPGEASAAFGFAAAATGEGSLAGGKAATAAGAFSIAWGNGAVALQGHSVAVGEGALAQGERTVAVGTGTIGNSYSSFTIGRWNATAGDKGTWNEEDPLFVVGNGKDGANRANALVLGKDGNLAISGNLTEMSDVRAKTGVAPLGPVLARLAGIRPVTYRFRSDVAGPSGPQIGLLAQEVRAAFPELVAADGDGELSVAYGKLSAVLLGAIREQQELLEAREREIAALEERLARLERAAAAR
jgi:hypothetical protein